MNKMSTTHKYERQGLAALYTFTPFKIIYTSSTTRDVRDSVVISFWGPRNMVGYYCNNVNDNLLSKPIQRIIEKCRKLEELWDVPLRDVVRGRIYLYTTFPVLEFSKQSRKYVVIINRDVLEHLRGKKVREEAVKAIEKAYKAQSFVLAEFTYESINGPNFCRYGLVPITHREKCPLIDVCPFKSSSSSCSYFISWSSFKENYAGLYKVVADVKIEIKEVEGRTFGIAKTLLLVPYRGKPLFEVVYVEPVNVLAYYDAINLLPKKYVPYNALRVKLNETLGLRLHMTSALRISFNDKTLEELINDLKKDQLAWSWLEFKARLLALANGIPGEKKRYIFKPWNVLERLCKSKEERLGSTLSKELNVSVSDLQKAVKFIAIHTIIHMLMLNLWSTLGLSSDELSYVIVPKDDSFEAWIFEAASGGYGYLRYLAEHREMLYNIVVNALQNVPSPNQCVVFTDSNTGNNIISMLRNMVTNTISGLKSTLPQYTKQLDDVNKQLNQFIDNIAMLYRNYNVAPHTYTVYRCLASIIPGELREHMSKVIERFLSIFSLFDGGIGSYYIEEGCIFGPFLQPFSISCCIAESLEKGVFQQGIDLPLKKPVIEWIKTAKTSIDVATWVLSIHNFKDLIKALRDACKNGAKIRILLGQGIYSDESASKSAIDSLNSLFQDQDLRKCLEVRLYTKEPLHAKMILVDGVTLIQGSFNLTKAALTSNKESAFIINEPEEVQKVSEEYNKIWSKSVPITKPDDILLHKDRTSSSH